MVRLAQCGVDLAEVLGAAGAKVIGDGGVGGGETSWGVSCLNEKNGRAWLEMSGPAFLADSELWLLT